jgi:hypothetical protein
MTGCNKRRPQIASVYGAQMRFRQEGGEIAPSAWLGAAGFAEETEMTRLRIVTQLRAEDGRFYYVNPPHIRAVTGDGSGSLVTFA